MIEGKKKIRDFEKGVTGLQTKKRKEKGLFRGRRTGCRSLGKSEVRPLRF